MGRGGTSGRGRATHTLIVDRWVDAETAAAELDGEHATLVPRALLPSESAPDVVLRVTRGASRVTITIDRRGTEAARQESERLSARLAERDPGGDVTL
jgi:hypothetical protein